MAVAITTPKGGTEVSGVIPVNADYTGTNFILATLTVDGNQVGVADRGLPISFTFDTKTKPDGVHKLQVHVKYKKSGNANAWQHSAEVTITVKNAVVALPNLNLSAVTTFYYPWYPETWSTVSKCTGKLEQVDYNPKLGKYDSIDVNAIDAHIKMMDYAGFDLAIYSWWGPDGSAAASYTHRESIIFPLVLERTRQLGSNLKWCPYYEKEGFGDPVVSVLKSDCQYLMDKYVSHPSFARINGKPVLFVYNADDGSFTPQEMLDRWNQAVGGDWFRNHKVFLNYKTLNNQPQGWHQYGPDARFDRQAGFSVSISPGRRDPKCPPEGDLPRDLIAFTKAVNDMKAATEPFKIVTTFNEWGEGTAVEPAAEWQSMSGMGTYLDALHDAFRGGGTPPPPPPPPPSGTVIEVFPRELSTKYASASGDQTLYLRGGIHPKGTFDRAIDPAHPIKLAMEPGTLIKGTDVVGSCSGHSFEKSWYTQILKEEVSDYGDISIRSFNINGPVHDIWVRGKAEGGYLAFSPYCSAPDYARDIFYEDLELFGAWGDLIHPNGVDGFYGQRVLFRDLQHLSQEHHDCVQPQRLKNWSLDMFEMRWPAYPLSAAYIGQGFMLSGGVGLVENGTVTNGLVHDYPGREINMNGTHGFKMAFMTFQHAGDGISWTFGSDCSGIVMVNNVGQCAYVEGSTPDMFDTNHLSGSYMNGYLGNYQGSNFVTGDPKFVDRIMGGAGQFSPGFVPAPDSPLRGRGHALAWLPDHDMMGKARTTPVIGAKV